MSLMVQILECRWCRKKVIPDIETNQYPKKCPNKSCRRMTWNKSDAEIRQGKLNSINALLDNHKDGKIRRKKSYNISTLNFLRKEKEKEKIIVCTVCELFFNDEDALSRHRERRGHFKTLNKIILCENK